jgi:hypothetical protein
MRVFCAILIINLGCALCFLGFGQTHYSGRLEIGYLGFQNTTVDIDPGPNWKGYNLDEQQNGLDVSLINGLKVANKFFAGVGLGYLNFEGIHGIEIFSDFQYLLLKSKLSPIINLKIGYNHIWNQYESGSNSALGELGIGLHYKLTSKIGVYVQSGFSSTQQSIFIPIRGGLSF